MKEISRRYVSLFISILKSPKNNEVSISIVCQLTQNCQISSRGISKSRRRNRRPRKDENAPRMPLTGYIRFLNDRRETIKMENPNMNFTEVTKLLGSEWSNMLPATKQVIHESFYNIYTHIYIYTCGNANMCDFVYNVIVLK